MISEEESRVDKLIEEIKEFFDSDIGLKFLSIFVMFIIIGIMCFGIYFSESNQNTTNYTKPKNSFGYRMDLRGKTGWGIGNNGINYYNFGK